MGRLSPRAADDKIGPGSADEAEVDVETETTIVIADDHPLFRGALRQAVSRLLPAHI